MRISFDMTIEDYVAFNRHHFKRSPSARRMRLVTVFAVSALAIGLSLAIEPGPDRSRAEFVTFSVLFSAIFAILFHYIYPASVGRQVRRLLKEGKNEGTFGSHELEIDEEGIVERTELKETRHSWKAVESIIETDGYAFIYTSSVAAYVIPKLAITAGDFDRFIERANELRQRTGNVVLSQQSGLN